MSATFEFYSDTNLTNAYDELQLMSINIEKSGWDTLVIRQEDMDAMGDSITAIVKDNGGQRVD